MADKLTPIHSALDPNIIFERGFVTREETETVGGLAQFSSKVNITDSDGENEGIWGAIISKEDRALYDGNSVGKPVRIVLTNHAVMFFPNPTWGRVLVGLTNGSSRPIFKREDQIERLKETHEAYMAEYPPKEKSDGDANDQH